MSIYPVEQDLIADDPAHDPHITPCLFIVHTSVTHAGGSGPAPHNGLEWHFYEQEYGKMVQRRDTHIEADANYHGNSFMRNGMRMGAISCETWGNGDEAWTDDQVEGLKYLFELAHNIDGIPYQVADAWNGDGFGYHRMYADWNHPYHSCPGDLRVAQWDAQIVPWLNSMRGNEIMAKLDDEDRQWFSEQFAAQAKLIDETVAKLTKPEGFQSDMAHTVSIGVKEFMDENMRKENYGKPVMQELVKFSEG